MTWRETPQTNSMLRTWMSNALECATSHVVLRSTTVSRELIERELCEDLPFYIICNVAVVDLFLLLYLCLILFDAFCWNFSAFISVFILWIKLLLFQINCAKERKGIRETLANECLLYVVHWWFEYKPNTFCSQCLFSSSHNHLILLPINKVVY